MQLTEEQIESIYESCHDKWLDSGKCINLWHTFAEYLLAAYDSGAQPLTDAARDAKRYHGRTLKELKEICATRPARYPQAHHDFDKTILALIAEIEHLDQAKGE